MPGFLILVASFWAAFKRIESNTENLRLAFEQTDLEDQLIELRSTKESGQVAYGMHTGQPLSEDERTKLIDDVQTRYNRAHQLLIQFAQSAYNYYHWRNYLLISGFVLLLVARVLKAYTCAP
jgi:ligand-binding SRPBCC domain-containing protein